MDGAERKSSDIMFMIQAGKDPADIYEAIVEALRQEVRKRERLERALEEIRCKYGEFGCGLSDEHTMACRIATQALKESRGEK